MKFDVLLVPVDFSDVTESVYAAAAALAGRLGARVFVLNVTEPEADYVGMAPPQAYVSADEAIERGANAGLQMAHEFFGRRGIQVEAVHITGPVVATILAEADRLDAGMIVVGTHGHGAIYSLLVGSVAEGVIRHAKVPVIVVPREGKEK